MERAGLTSENVKALSASSQYLANLARGLSYLVTDASAGVAGQTRLAPWSAEIKPLLRAVLPRQVDLACELPDDLPAVAISSHALSQFVFNVVQNAGKAIGERPARVEVTASVDEQAGNVRITVHDTGLERGDAPAASSPGDRCARRARRLRHGLSAHAFNRRTRGGTLEVKSTEGAGTDVCLTLPS